MWTEYNWLWMETSGVLLWIW